MDSNLSRQHAAVLFRRESDLALLRATSPDQRRLSTLPSGAVMRPLPLQTLGIVDYPASTQEPPQFHPRPQELRAEEFPSLHTQSYGSYQQHPSMMIGHDNNRSNLPGGQRNVDLCTDASATRLRLLQQLNNTMEQELERFRQLRNGLAEACVGQAGSSAGAHAEDTGLGRHSSHSEATAIETGNAKETTKAVAKKVRKKPKDQPRRPLSAYNLFFREERARILAEIPEGQPSSSPNGKRTRKRKKRPHGKIGFESLAKIIGWRWKQLPPGKLHQYKEMAANDMRRYKAEMEVYLAGKETDKTSGPASSVDTA